MDNTFEGMIRQINDKEYHNVATAIFEAYKDRLAEAGESWLAKIEGKLKSIHEDKLSTGLFSKTKKEMGGETCAETIDWLEKELGIERKGDTLAWRLGITS